MKQCSVFFDPLKASSCVRCGQASEAWLVNDGRIVRVCRPCARVYQGLCHKYQGRELHCVVADRSGYTDYVLINGEWLCYKCLSRLKSKYGTTKTRATVCLEGAETPPDPNKTAPEGQEAVSKIPGRVILPVRTDSGTKGNYETTGPTQKTAMHNGLATPNNGSERLRNADSKRFFTTGVITPPADKTRLKTQKQAKQGATVCLGAVEPLPDGNETAPEGQEAVSKIPGGVILLGRTDSGTKGNYATTGSSRPVYRRRTE